MKVPPAPTPNVNLPLEIKFVDMTVCARVIGFRKAGIYIDVPSSIVFVIDAIDESVINGSILGLAKILSPTHSESILLVSA